MADRMAHEIGNTMVPLSTHQQLLTEKYKDAEFRQSLDHALADGVKRVTRLINQMRFLAREGQLEAQAFPVEKIDSRGLPGGAQTSGHRNHASYSTKTAANPSSSLATVPRLKHALAEIMLNALQANPKKPTVGVHLSTASNKDGRQDLQIEIEDNGSGFTAETAQKVPSPFFTTRNVGLGLGLTVSRKIIETHRGKLEIVPPQAGQHGIVRVSLPIDSAVATAA